MDPASPAIAMPESSSQRPPSGCAMFGIYTGMFGRRRSTSMCNLSRAEEMSAPAPKPAQRKAGVRDDSSLVCRPKAMQPPPPMQAPINSGAAGPHAQPGAGDIKGRKTEAGNGAARTAAPTTKTAAEYTGMAAELDKMILDHQKVKGTTQMMRATSGNMMMHRNLGNLNAVASTRTSLDRSIPKAANERKAANGYAHPGMGNIVKEAKVPPPASSLCRALSHRTDPEKLKEMGNEEYREGHYTEALALYDQAIMMDPGRPAYWSNKAAALAALGRLIDAVSDGKEAVRLDPSYGRAHHRLGGLYLRLGEPDKAINHFKQSTKESMGADVKRAQSVKSRIARCSDARMLKDWITVLQESKAAVGDGADFAPQVMALQAEALLRLQRYDEADSVFRGAAWILGDDQPARFFGATGHAYVLMVRAQVDMAAGRLDDAVATAQTACQLDPSNREVANVHRRAKVVASARLRGNALFKASKFAEACAAYGEGLDKGEPGSAVLLCNRAACFASLGKHERAVEDCTGALAVRPAYSKARLRRADCNAKLGQLEASLKDYQVLIQELPDNEDVKKGLSEVEAKLRSRRNGVTSQH